MQIILSTHLKVSAQSVIPNFYGEWVLDKLEQTIFRNEKISEKKTWTMESIERHRNNLPEDLFLIIHFFNNDQMGLCSTDGNIESLLLNTDASFVLKKNRLIINQKKGKNKVFDFTFRIDNDRLSLDIDMTSHKYAGTRYRRNLTYRLTQTFKENQ